MEDPLPEWLHGLAEPGQGIRVLSHQLLYDVLNHVVLTSGYASDLDSAPMKVWGWREWWRG